MKFKYIGRDASSSPATGSYTIHGLEQERIINETLEASEKVAPAGS
jgi:2-oxoglutarate dehydrogenase complex dehydrogenase (E1) component-like enzyme